MIANASIAEADTALDNKLVYEHYFSFVDSMQAASLPSSDVLQDLRSITKTIVGATVLIAHAQGAIENLDQSIFEFFPDSVIDARPSKH